MLHCLLPPLLAGLALLATFSAHAARPQIVLEQSRASRETFIESLRRTGEMEFARLGAAEATLRKAIDDPESAEAAPELLPELLFELGSVIRLAFRFTDAIPILEKAAVAAEAAGRGDLAFDAWLDVARSHLLGPRDHGAAAAALEKAILVAGDAPTDRQRFRIADYRAMLLSARNDIGAGFVAAAEAIRAAQTPDDHFNAHYDVASLFVGIAQSCDYIPFFDGCRRAVDAAEREYLMAARIAHAAGWPALAARTEKEARDLDRRRDIIDEWESIDKMGQKRPELFAPLTGSGVLVSSRFGTEPSALVRNKEDLQKRLAAATEEGKVYGLTQDAQTVFNTGLLMDLRGEPERASQLYLAAVRRLDEERGSLFDPRRRGTMIENRAEVYSTAALRLLDLGRPEPAFEILERMRARGLAELMTLGEQDDIGPAERSFLSKLLLLEAKASRSERTLREHAVEAGALNADDPSLDELLKLERDRSALLREHPETAKKLAGSPAWSPVSPAELQAMAIAARTSVLMYWTGHANLVVWHIGPGGSSVRSVLLPSSVLREKVGRLRDSAERSSKPFDTTVARELYLFLIAPMPQLNGAERLIIVPQGDLFALPFEILINPATQRYLIEEAEVSYAPNASYAARALTTPPVHPVRPAAVVDEAIDARTQEIDGMQVGLGAAKVRQLGLYQLTSLALKAGLAGADIVHLLVHGQFDEREPLLSTLDIKLADRPKRGFYATDLLDLPIGQARLAVLSACESGEIKGTIANEIYGIPWVLLAAGVPTVVLSRWRVDAEATGRWMGRFYKALAEDGSPGRAAAVAMRGQLAEAATAHPYFWAGLQVTGR